MFDSKTTLTGRLSDAVDLLIDFATLGEYGLEPVGRAPEPCKVDRRSQYPTNPLRGPRPSRARMRGVRGASETSAAIGVAWQRHASRSTTA
jgi:hypothetical protein